eukprot:2564875-Karenia_brevis.AAC.1
MARQKKRLQTPLTTRMLQMIRSGVKHEFTITADETVADFKTVLWRKFHGEEALGEEEAWHQSHNVQMAKGGKILGEDATFSSLGFEPGDVPYEITFCIGLKGGGKRAKPAGGNANFDQATRQKLATILNNVQTIATTPVTDNSLKLFFDGLSDDALDAVVKIVNNKMNTSYKMTAILNFDPTLTALEEQ